MSDRNVTIELLPHERAALLNWNFTPEVRTQLEALASSEDVETITLPRFIVRWVAGDLTHAIVKRGCRDEEVIELSERFDYIDESGDGRLDCW